ncbi:hypothetical protein RGQ29_032790 [Quercus rubra]|uniref:RIN4 pathogenic type III effector avirulence factor Avr cleavage site domain-containing protein n=1 Tax=Quercus rubra TaxID=3512 RepID=A0AAN7DUX5_QUERU|nr:hypothetical protein RGQ29_032790 [Quercus rubra]
MAKNSHVPKFGSWDNDNIPYTSYFDNARKKKSSVKMNPDYPEENPEAFMYMTGVTEINADYHAFQDPLHVNSSKSNSSVGKQHIEGHTRHHAHQRNTVNQPKIGSKKSITSEYGSDKSNSDHSIMQPNHQRVGSDHKKKSLAEGSNTFALSIPGHAGKRSGSHPSVETHHRAVSVPKFGAWDELDPKSGEGFTAIFNKVKEGKQIASSQFPNVSPQPSYYPSAQRHGQSSSRSKICCCLFSSGSE